MSSASRFHFSRLALLFFGGLAALVSCRNENSETSSPLPESALARVGTIVISEQDIQHRIGQHHDGRDDDDTRKAALEALVRRARFVQAALDAGVADDPAVREDIGRLLESRLRERILTPRLREQLEISADRLAELYAQNQERFQSPEKRRVATLWLNPGSDPDRTSRYLEKMGQARAFVLQSEDLVTHPEKGFASLGADYSEHQPSRYRGGEVGWLQREGGLDPWSKAVAEIAFAIENPGDLSEVLVRPEGIFLIRLMEIRPKVTRSFDSVAADLEREERTRLRKQLEAEFEQEITSKYAVEWAGG